jgi:hypothetical protein
VDAWNVSIVQNGLPMWHGCISAVSLAERRSSSSSVQKSHRSGYNLIIVYNILLLRSYILSFVILAAGLFHFQLRTQQANMSKTDVSTKKSDRKRKSSGMFIFNIYALILSHPRAL